MCCTPSIFTVFYSPVLFSFCPIDLTVFTIDEILLSYFIKQYSKLNGSTAFFNKNINKIHVYQCWKDMVDSIHYMNIYGKAAKSNALNWLPISICLDLSTSFAILESLTSYVSVLMLLMRCYSLKRTYSIPKFSIFI